MKLQLKEIKDLFKFDFLKQYLKIQAKALEEFAEFEGAINSLTKLSGMGYVSAQVYVDEMDKRFTEKPKEIASVLCRYSANGRSIKVLSFAVFKEPLSYYSSRNLSLSAFIEGL
ncbi:MAG: hypothetical protein ABJL71_18865 [Cyclobacteriaceae bacterium]